MSSQPSIITSAIGNPPSHMSCQFANLVLFYLICSEISKVSQLYYINEEELHSILTNHPSLDLSNIDYSQTLSIQIKKLIMKKRKRRVSKNVQPQSSEYDFIKTMIS